MRSVSKRFINTVQTPLSWLFDLLDDLLVIISDFVLSTASDHIHFREEKQNFRFVESTIMPRRVVTQR